MGNNLLTIVLPTHNRLDLLKKAFYSCCRQTSKAFDLIIIDNGSHDGTVQWLESVSTDHSDLKIIFNGENIGSIASLMKAMSFVDTPWSTILCDDDSLDERFVETCLERLVRTDRGFVAVGFQNVNPDGQVLKSHPQTECTLDAYEGIDLSFRGRFEVAGISGFCFRTRTFFSNPQIRDYPKGFFTDTMLGVQAILDNGMETIKGCLYKRLIWPGSESAFSPENSLMYFESRLRFGKNLGVVLEGAMAADPRFNNFLAPQPLLQFIRVVVLPFFKAGSLNPEVIRRFFAIAKRDDRRYLKHCFLLLFFYPVINGFTLGVRKKLWISMKKVFCRHV